jgi:hypothetical protein
VSRCITRCDVSRRHIRCRSSGSCGCAARQRQRHADDSQHRHGFLPTLSLRSLLRLWHGRPPHMPSRECSTPVALFVRLCKGTLQGRIRTLTGHSLQAAYRRTERSTSSLDNSTPPCVVPLHADAGFLAQASRELVLHLEEKVPARCVPSRRSNNPCTCSAAPLFKPKYIVFRLKDLASQIMRRKVC